MNSETVPHTAVDPFANQPHAIVERDGVRYTLHGTAHVSKDSVSAVRAAIACDEFDAGPVEPDEQRLQGLRTTDTWAHLYGGRVRDVSRKPLWASNHGHDADRA